MSLRSSLLNRESLTRFCYPNPRTAWSKDEKPGSAILNPLRKTTPSVFQRLSLSYTHSLYIRISQWFLKVLSFFSPRSLLAFVQILFLQVSSLDSFTRAQLTIKAPAL